MRRHIAILPGFSSNALRHLPGFFLSLLLALPLWAGAALPAAQNSAVTAPGSASRFDRGLLWKIEFPGATASYLFGTIHSDDARVTALPEAVTQSLDGARRFIMEAVIDGQALMSMAEVMFYSDGRSLEQVVGKQLYADCVKALTARGMPVAGFERQKPWAVMMALSVPPPQSGEFLDLVLQSRATRMNKPVSGLETIAEQLSIFDGLPTADQVALLQDTIRSLPDLSREFEALHKAWLARDLAGILALGEEQKPGDDRIYRDVMDRLLNQRNRRMAERMGPILREGGAFVAVGAAHLPGETGLLYRLEQAGYRVSPVY